LDAALDRRARRPARLDRPRPMGGLPRERRRSREASLLGRGRLSAPARPRDGGLPERLLMDWIEEADGVFRGGGVKGLGLAGALLGFAEHPTKPVKTWVNVAGASAGAIIACYLACGHDAADMADLLKRTKFDQFQDFPPGG